MVVGGQKMKMKKNKEKKNQIGIQWTDNWVVVFGIPHETFLDFINSKLSLLSKWSIIKRIPTNGLFIVLFFSIGDYLVEIPCVINVTQEFP